MQDAYLISKKGRKRRAHLWTGGDTYCRLFSTGGMNSNKRFYTVSTDPEGREICTMCRSVAASRLRKEWA